MSDRKYPEFWFAGRENVTPLLARFNEVCQQPEVRVVGIIVSYHLNAFYAAFYIAFYVRPVRTVKTG